MPLNREAKAKVIASVNNVASTAVSAVVAEYRGLTVAQVTALREKARNDGVYLRVIRNTLAKRAVENTDFACLQETLTGPLIYAFSKEDPGAAARLVKDFTKEHDALKVKALSIGGKLLAANELNTLAKIPTKDQAIAQLMSVMQGPISKFVRTLVEPTSKLVRTFAAVREKKASS